MIISGKCCDATSDSQDRALGLNTYHFADVKIKRRVIIFFHFVEMNKIVDVGPHVVVVLDMIANALKTLH